MGVVRRAFFGLETLPCVLRPTAPHFTAMSASSVTTGWSEHGRLTRSEPLRVLPWKRQNGESHRPLGG